MMMKKCKIVLVALLSVLFVTCKNKEKSPILNAIPENAVLVVEIKNQQIYDKGGEGISDLIQMIQKSFSSLDMNLVEISEVISGKDTSFVQMKKSYFYSVPKNISRNEFYAAFITEVVDKNKLEAKITELNPNLKITKKGDFSEINNGSMTIAWNSNLLIMIGGNFEDSDLESALSLKEENSICKNEDFQKFIKNGDDVGLWLSSSQFLSLLPKLPESIQEVWKDSYMHFGLNFNMGNIKFSMNMEPEKKFIEYQKKIDIIKSDFDNSILELFPAQTLFAFKLSINFKNYLALLKEMPQYSSIIGSDPELINVIESLGGDVFYSLYDVKNMIPQMGLAFTMKDEDANKLTSKLSGLTSLSKKNNYQYFNLFGNTVYFGNKNGKVYLSNDESGIQSFEGKGYNENFANSSLSSLFANHSTVMYLTLDPNKYPKELMFMLSANRNSKQVLSFLNACDYFIVYSDITEGYAEIKLKDDSKNALSAILGIIQEQIK